VLSEVRLEPARCSPCFYFIDARCGLMHKFEQKLKGLGKR